MHPPVTVDDVGFVGQILGQLPGAVYATDADGIITYYNQAAAELWGRRPVLGTDQWCGSLRIYDGDGNPMKLEDCPMAIALREGRNVRGIPIIIERPDGSRRHVLPHPMLIRDEAGALIGGSNLLIEIGERIRSDRAAQLLSSIVESSEDAIVSHDAKGAILSWNRGAEHLFRCSASEALGQPITRFLTMPSDPGASGRSSLEMRGRRADGTTVPVSATVSPVCDGRDRVVGSAFIVRDITEPLRLREEAERARDEAEAASRAKDQFFATLSHELRTPLNPVLLLASAALEDPSLPLTHRETFEQIHRGVTLQSRLIDDMLDLARISRGRLELREVPVIFDEILCDALRTVEAEAEEKHVKIAPQLLSKNAGIRGDPVRLQQVFWNVLRNAVKFSQPGGVIGVTTRLDESAGLYLCEIADGGIGMSADEIAAIFDIPVVDARPTPGLGGPRGGLGLGLTISRQLAALHGGRISARSGGPGAGTTVALRFPVEVSVVQGMASKADVELDEPASRDPTADEACTVLVVDDHVPTCVALSQYLRHRGYHVATAHSVAEARAAFQKQRIDILLSDIGLPDGSGYELMEEIRRSSPSVEGVALSGYGMSADVDASKKAGFVEHCTKPLDVSHLRRVLRRLRSGG